MGPAKQTSCFSSDYESYTTVELGGNPLLSRCPTFRAAELFHILSVIFPGVRALTVQGQMAAAAIIEEAWVAEAGESALARRFASGDQEALEEVIALYRVRVARLAHRLLGWGGDPEDVVQEVFLTALRKAKDFRGRASLWTWLATITLNRCRRQLQRRALWRRILFARSREETAVAADR